MISRVFLSLAAVVAALGLLFVGMGMAYSPRRHGLEHLGLAMLIGGAIGILLGMAWYRQTEKGLQAELERIYGPGQNG